MCAITYNKEFLLDLGTDVGSPNVQTSWDYNYILKRTSDANSVLLFHGLSLDRLSGPAGRPNIRSCDDHKRPRQRLDCPHLGRLRCAFKGVGKAMSWQGVYTNAAMVVFPARSHSLPSLVSCLGSHTDNVNAAVVDSGYWYCICEFEPKMN
nr:hypothetical protein [Tanacetum cinerariifolium]